MAKSQLWRTLGFALVVGPTALLWMFLTTRHFGYVHSLALFAVGSVVMHPLALGDNWRQSLRGTAFAAALGIPLLLFTDSATAVAVLSLVILGLVRSAILLPRPFARAIAYELVFLGAGVLSTWFFLDGSVVGIVFSTWAFWLIQAGFVLTPNAIQPIAAPSTDPFDRACAAAAAVLEGRPR